MISRSDGDTGMVERGLNTMPWKTLLVLSIWQSPIRIILRPVHFYDKKCCKFTM